jgi:hypothetical protein
LEVIVSLPFSSLSLQDALAVSDSCEPLLITKLSALEILAGLEPDPSRAVPHEAVALKSVATALE